MTGTRLDELRTLYDEHGGSCFTLATLLAGDGAAAAVQRAYVTAYAEIRDGELIPRQRLHYLTIRAVQVS